ncbi:flagellar protein FlaG [Neobacillus jeddahensis]|uniref:flagellar protein FlaG n=1 Tax=Neobacillus jeddahensis TaxID=1461580 RepID=UPI00058BCE62|nr:flagellar protein FlaG [Neobacillus jeddahensis]
MLDKVLPTNSATDLPVKPVEQVGQIASTPKIREKSAEQQELPQQPITKEKTEKVIESMNEFLKASNTHLKFQYHEDLQKYYVAIVDDTTNEVVKEIPPKKLLDMYAAMEEYMGLLFDKKA